MPLYPVERLLVGSNVVVVGEAHDVDLAVGFDVVQDLVDRCQAVAEGRVDVQDRLAHALRSAFAARRQR